MAQIAVRLPDRLVREIETVAHEQQSSRSDVVRKALDAYLHRLAAQRDAAVYERQPLSDPELALADDAEGWTATPAW